MTNRKLFIVIEDGMLSEIYANFRPDFEIRSIDFDTEGWATIEEAEAIERQYDALVDDPEFSEVVPIPVD